MALAVGGGAPSTAAGAGTLAIDPEDVDFGVLLPQAGDERSVAIRNLGPDPVTLGDIYMVGDVDPFDFTGGTCDLGELVPAGGDCTVMLRFAPQEAGDFEVVLVAEGGEDDEPAAATVKGRSRPPGTLVASPSAIDFGGVRVGTISSPQVIRIHNNGGNPIDIETIIVNGGMVRGAPTIPNRCGTGYLAPLATCEIPVTSRAWEYPFITSKTAVQASEVSIRALIGDGLQLRPFSLRIPMSVTALQPSGAPFPSPDYYASIIRSDLTRMARAALRLVRGGPARELELPRFRGGPYGRLRLLMHARTARGWVKVADASRTSWHANTRLAFRLSRSGRRLLRGPDPVPVKVQSRFRATDRSFIEAATERAKVRPPKVKRKRR